MNSINLVLAILFIGLVVVGVGMLVAPLLIGKRKRDKQTKILTELTSINDNILAICSKTLSTFASHPLSKKLVDDPNVALLFQKHDDLGKLFKRIRGYIIHLHPVHPEVHNFAVVINHAKYEFKNADITLGIISNALTALIQSVVDQTQQPTAQEQSFVFNLQHSITHLEEGRHLAGIASQQLDNLELVMNTIDYSKNQEAAK